MIKIFIINLQQDADKKSYMIDICKRNNLSCEFIDAIDGYSLDDKEIGHVYSSRQAIRIFKRELSPGEVGCALSHLKIYHKVIDENIERAIILEDDVALCDDFSRIVENLNALPNECECLLLGYDDDIKNDLFLYLSYWGRKKFINEYKAVRFVKVALGTYGYMITQRGVRKLLQDIVLIDKPIDHYTGGLDKLNLYGLLPRCVHIADHHFAESKIVKERDEFKKMLYNPVYNTGLTQWLNRIRIGIILFFLKSAPISFSQGLSMHLFKNRRKKND